MQSDLEDERTNTTDEAMMVDGLQLISHDASRGFEDGLSARALLSSIRRHLAMVLAFTLSLGTAGALVGLGLPSWFKAETVLIIHARQQRIADVQELQDPLPDFAVIRSEVDVLQSRSVVEPVVRSLGLWRLPEYQKRDYPGGWKWQTVETSLRALLGVASESEAETPELPLLSARQEDGDAPPQAVIDEAVEKYTGYLLVGTDGRSMTIQVSYRAWTPERAATIVNAHIQSYQNLQEQAKVKAAQRANSALTTQMAGLRKQLQAAEAAVTNYREQHHLTGVAKDSGALSQQLAALNSQLITARADLAENEARAARISAGAKGGADSIPEVVASGTISQLRGQEAQLAAREADLGKYHGDEYPELRRVRASLQNLQGQITREIGRGHVAALQLVERSRTRERSIQQSITELTKQVNSADAGLQQLQGNADSIRAVLRDFEKRAQETAANPAFITANSTLASPANPSAVSTSPKAPMLALVGGFVGLTFGGLIAVFRESRDKTFRTSTQLEQELGSLTVGATPRALGRRRKSPADVILSDNRSVFAEAVRLSWANIQLTAEDPKTTSFGGRRPGTVLGITSAASGEGKSTHALAFARTAALAGESVVVVDADLRRSGFSRLLDQEFCFTLRDFLQDRCAVNEVISIEERSGVHFVPSTPADVAWTSQDLQRFFNFVDYLKDRFRVVIIDLPPILGLAETIRLAVAVDSIALIIRWGRTERQFVQFALDALRNAGVAARAVILNDIDLKVQQRRGYRDRTMVYTDEFYRAVPGYREPAPRPALPVAAAASDARSETSREDRPRNEERRRNEEWPRVTDRNRSGDVERRPATAAHAAGSDIERLYNKYHG